MRVAILSGSVRKERQSHKVAEYLCKQLNTSGLEVDLIDLAKSPLPILGSDYETHSYLKDNIQNISQRLDEAQALVFVTPEYHGSFSGVLKNVLDHFGQKFPAKPIGVVAASAGKMAGINASTQLQHVILSLGAFPMPLKLLVPEVNLAFDKSLEPQRKDVVLNTNRFIKEFQWFSQAIIDASSNKADDRAA